jgi:pimeloyl-ACP methyl ester carboxylesterase
MLSTMLLAAVVAQPVRGEVTSILVQVAPAPAEGRGIVRSPGQTQAVILIHGLTIHPMEERLIRAQLHNWQKPDSQLVRRLSSASDVFSFAYGQGVTLTEIVERSELRNGIRYLRDLGYSEIVLLGHSAGGIIARQVVEDHPDLPVTRVVQVSTPNLGSAWASIQMPWSAQKVFTADLTRMARQQTQNRRADIRIPNRVEFVCIVSNAIFQIGDGLVPVEAQWTPDLIAQRIPVHTINTTHRAAVYYPEAAAAIAWLATTPQPRWTEGEIEAARFRLLGK